jgi:DNA polymerase-3 subunit gamma/tau
VRLERPANLDEWRAILTRIRASRAPLASILEHAVPLEVTRERVLLGYEAQSFLGAQAADPEAMDLLQREARAHFANAETKVALDLTMRPSTVATVAAIDAEQRRIAMAKAKEAVEKHPLVQKAIAIFGAELREVRLPGGEE